MTVTVIRLDLSGELVAVTHHASLSDGLAVAAAYQPPSWSYLVEGRDVARLGRPDGPGWRLVQATGCQIIRLHDALRGDDGLNLYRFTVRPIALERMLAVLGERHPAPAEVEELPTVSCRGVKE